MNGAQIHLGVNHLPVMGALLGALVLAAGWVLKNGTVRRTGVALLAFSALATLPAYFSGEEAEEVIEHLPGVSEALIHDHEEAAELATCLMSLLTCSFVAPGTIAQFSQSMESSPIVPSMSISSVSADLFLMLKNSRAILSVIC